MNSYSPFLDIKSFVTGATETKALQTALPASSPFLAIYELEGEGRVDPQTEAYFEFLNELYDEQFNETLSNLVDEATDLHQSNFVNEQADPRATGYRAERLLTQHFAPLVAETEAMFRTVAAELDKRDPNTLSEAEVETIVDGYRAPAGFSPSFEAWLGGVGSWLKKTVKKGVDLAKKAGSTLAKWGLGPLLNKIKGFAKDILKRVIEQAIGKLPAQYQSTAKLLAGKLGIATELEMSEAGEGPMPGTYAVAELQNEFNRHVANLLFAQTEAAQDLEIAQAANQPASEVYPVAELAVARERFIDGLVHLREGEDPTPQVENFLPALLQAARVVVPMIGRPKVVDTLAKPIAYLIKKFVGPENTPALSKAIADVGLRLLKLETAPQNEAWEAASAVASTVEETVQRLAALPEYMLDNQALFEGAVLDAFEHAAAANLPPLLSENTYRQRPELREHRRGFWRRGRHYKKRMGSKIKAMISPHKLASLETFDGSTVGEALEEQYAIEPGDELEVEVHLYEATAGTRLSDIVREEEVIPKIEGVHGRTVLHPLTRDAAALLLDQPELGRDFEGETGDPNAPQVGQRFYYLEIPGKRPLMVPTLGGRAHVRRRSRLRLVFDFPKNVIDVNIFLSEVRAQHLAVKLRQNSHLGVVIDRLRHFIRRRVDRAFSANRGGLSLIGVVVPGQPVNALNRLPALVPRLLRGRLTEWIVKGLADNLQKQAQAFIHAADDTADGVTMMLTLENPPGFAQLNDALKGKGVSLATLKAPEGNPTIRLQISAGGKHG